MRHRVCADTSRKRIITLTALAVLLAILAGAILPAGAADITSLADTAPLSPDGVLPGFSTPGSSPGIVWSGYTEGQQSGIAATDSGMVLIAAKNGSFSMQAERIGHADAVAPVGEGTFRTTPTRLEIVRPGATEWYIIRNSGIEQGMTLSQRPGGDGPLAVSFRIYGDLRPALPAGQVLLFSDENGPVMAYSHLSAEDSTGKVLPSSLSLDGSRLTWQVDDREAVYPVTIDPIIVSTANATFLAGEAQDYFGYAVALSSDGNTTLVGGYGNQTSGTFTGGAFLFTKPPGGWSGTTSAVSANAQFFGGAAFDYFGRYVAVSSDGSTAVITANQNGTGGMSAGAAYLFTKPSGGWSGTTRAFSANTTLLGGAANDQFGYSAAISSDGNTLLVGAIYNDTTGSNAGSAYIFTKPTGGWTGNISASSANATFTGGATGDQFGYSVALLSDGSAAVIGSPYNITAGANAGAAYLYTRPPGGWSGTTPASSAAARFTGSENNELFGGAVAVSSDGNTTLVSACQNATAGSNAGSVYLFLKPSGGWSGTTPSTSADARFLGATAQEQMGVSVALSSNGSILLFGANLNKTDGSSAGAAYLFTKPSGGWPGTTPASSAAAQLHSGADSDNFGYSVSLLPDGSTSLIGSPYNKTVGSVAGAAYIFIPNLSEPSPTPTPTPAPAPDPTSSGSDSSNSPASQSGGQAGTGVSVAEPALAGESVTFSFGDPSITYPVSIRTVTIVAGKAIGNSECIVSSGSPIVRLPDTGNPAVYDRIEIYWINPDDIASGTIAFSVMDSWLRENNVQPADIVLLREHDNFWSELPTTFDRTQDGFSYYTATTPGFSQFAVSVNTSRSISLNATPEETETPTFTPTFTEIPTPSVQETLVTPTATIAPAPSKGIPAWVWAAVFLIVIAAVGGIVFWRKQSEKPAQTEK